MRILLTLFGALFFLGFIFFFSPASQALAQKPEETGGRVFDFSQEDPSYLLKAPGEKEETLEDYINIYYGKCVKGNNNQDIAQYVQIQCACTAATASKIMTKKNMRDIFTKQENRDFLLSRLMEYGYIPCMKESIRNIVFDNCLDSTTTQRRIRNPRHVCNCVGEGMAKYVQKQARHMMPSFDRFRFFPERSPDNPLQSVLSHRLFDKKSRSVMSSCLAQYELPR